MDNDLFSTNEPLDIFGQNARLSRLYTQLCLCFPLVDTSPTSQDAVIKSLKNGLMILTQSFPWMAGHVIQDNSSVYRIEPLGRTPKLLVRDLTSQLPAVGGFRAAGFPFELLDEKVVAPRGTLPERFDDPAEVLLLQANFISGGLLLVITGQHNCMDVAGQGQVMYLFSKACRGEKFTDDELRVGNFPRKNIIPLLPAAEEKERQQRLQQDQAKPHSQPTDSSPPSKEITPPTPQTSLQPVWAYLIFSPTALLDLKHLAGKIKTTSFISTDDIVSATLWQAVIRARLPRFTSPETTKSTFQRQVNVRKHLGLPATYTGNAVYAASTSYTIKEVASQPVGTVASWLRSSLNETDFRYQAMAAATAIAKAAHESSGKESGSSNKNSTRSAVPSTDIKMSSWAKEACYDLDFGEPLGKPEAVRRPAFDAWEGLAYLMPKRLDGELVAAICLRQDDMERLKANDELARFSKYVG